MGTSLISIVRISFHAAKTATATTMKFAIVLSGLLAVIGGSYSIPTENDGSPIEPPAANAAADVNGPPEAKSDNAGDDADADDDDEDGEDEVGDDDDDDDQEDEEDDEADDDGTEEGA